MIEGDDRTGRPTGAGLHGWAGLGWAGQGWAAAVHDEAGRWAGDRTFAPLRYGIVKKLPILDYRA